MWPGGCAVGRVKVMKASQFVPVRVSASTFCRTPSRGAGQQVRGGEALGVSWSDVALDLRLRDLRSDVSTNMVESVNALNAKAHTA